jgi:hypothetical protein
MRQTGVGLGVSTFFKKTHRFWTPIFWERVVLFLKTETDNPLSNFAWSKMQSISIERYQDRAFFLCRKRLLTLHKLMQTETDKSTPQSRRFIRETPASLESFDRQKAHLFLCGFWRRVDYLVRKKIHFQGTFFGVILGARYIWAGQKKVRTSN